MKSRFSKFKILDETTLRKLSTVRLLSVFNSARAVTSCIYHYAGRRCCELCHEYIGDDYEKDVVIPARPYAEYEKLIKSILSERENVKKKQKKRRR